MTNNKITPLVDELEALLGTLETFYANKLGTSMSEVEIVYLDDLRDMIATIKEEIGRVKLIEDWKVEIMNDDLYYEASYLENLLMDELSSFEVALMQAKNVIRSAGDVLQAASKLK